MSQRPNRSFVVAHLSDPETDSASSFRHAVALADAAGGGLVAFHAADEGAEHAHDGSGVPDSIEFVSHTTSGADLLAAVRGLRPDLVVTATQRVHELERLFRGSHTGRVARNLALPTLFLGVDDSGLLEPDGSLSIRRVLLPSLGGARENVAIMGALRFVQQLRLQEPEITFVGVGNHAPPANEFPNGVPSDRIRWERYHELGDVAPTIAGFAETHHADLIVMVTDGRDSIGDEVRGTVTERVIRRSHRAVLSLPNQ